MASNRNMLLEFIRCAWFVVSKHVPSGLFYVVCCFVLYVALYVSFVASFALGFLPFFLPFSL
jgi:hypothetical protein